MTQRIIKQEDTDFADLPLEGAIFTDAAQDYRLASAGGSLTIQGQDSGEQTAFGLFSKDGDGTDNVYNVYFGKGSSVDVTNSESMLVGYISSSTDFQIFSNADGTGTLRPINIYTEGNYGQLELNTDGSLGLVKAFNLSWVEITDDTPTVDVALLRPQTVGHDGYFAITGQSGDGTENTGFAVLASGLSPLADNSQVLVMAYGEGSPGAFSIASLGNGTEEALDLAIGLSDELSGVTNYAVLNRDGDFKLNDVFYSNSVTKASAFGTLEPQDLNVAELPGLTLRALLTLNSSGANDLGDSILGYPLRLEQYEDENGNNTIISTIAGGTKASPTKAPGGTEIFSALSLVYDGTDWNLGGSVTISTAADSDDGCIVALNATGGSLRVLETGDVTITGDLTSLNGVTYSFPSSGSTGYFHRASDGTVTFDDFTDPVQVKDTVNLENQTASIGSTGFSNIDTAAGLYRISFYLVIDGTQGGESVTINFQWDDGVQTQITGGTLNTTDGLYANGEIVIRKAASTTVSYSTSCTTTLTTADYNLYMKVEKL